LSEWRGGGEEALLPREHLWSGDCDLANAPVFSEKYSRDLETGGKRALLFLLIQAWSYTARPVHKEIGPSHFHDIA